MNCCVQERPSHDDIYCCCFDYMAFDCSAHLREVIACYISSDTSGLQPGSHCEMCISCSRLDKEGTENSLGRLSRSSIPQSLRILSPVVPERGTDTILTRLVCQRQGCDWLSESLKSARFLCQRLIRRLVCDVSQDTSTVTFSESRGSCVVRSRESHIRCFPVRICFDSAT